MYVYWEIIFIEYIELWKSKIEIFKNDEISVFYEKNDKNGFFGLFGAILGLFLLIRWILNKTVRFVQVLVKKVKR